MHLHIVESATDMIRNIISNKERKEREKKKERSYKREKIDIKL